MANFCGGCGSSVVAEQKFCPRCGAPLGATAPQATGEPVARPRRGFLIGASLLALLLLAGGAALLMFRSRPPAGSSPHPPAEQAVSAPLDLSRLPGTQFEVTYKPETVVLDPAATQKSFEGVSADGNVFVFNRTNPAIATLHAGNVLLLQGVALKRVVAVEQQGDSLIVGTQPGTLTDAIQDGHIHWDTPITFDTAGGSATLTASPLDAPRSSWAFSGASSPVSLAAAPAWAFAPAAFPAALIAAPEGKSGSEGDWKFTTKATKEEGRLTLDVEIQGRPEGMTVDVVAKGHVQSFGLITDIQISHGVIEQFQYVAKNLRGDVDIDLLAKKTGDGPLKGLEVKLPAPIEMPLPLGGIPFVLSISGAVIVKPSLSAKNEIAHGHFKITYGGAQGFSVNGPGMTSAGTPDGTQEITDASSVAIAPFAYILALALPRIELTIGLEKALGLDKLVKAIPPAVTDRVKELLSKTTLGAQIADVAEKTLKSQAAASVEMVMVASHLDSGPLVLLPCRKTTFDVHANVGYDANALGKTSQGSKELELAGKHIIQQVPPNIRCGE